MNLPLLGANNLFFIIFDFITMEDTRNKTELYNNNRQLQCVAIYQHKLIFSCFQDLSFLVQLKILFCKVTVGIYTTRHHYML